MLRELFSLPLRERKLSEILSKRPEDLAPEFGAIIKSIIDGRGAPDPDDFLCRTYLTDAYKGILREVFNILKTGGTYVLLLNVEMGSGKTHLLTLLIHLFQILPQYEFPLSSAARQVLAELEKLGYCRDHAKRTVVIAADLRSSKFNEVLRFLIKSLNKAGVSKYVIDYLTPFVDKSLRELIDEAAVIGKELADRLDEDRNVIILLDELFFAALRDVAERKETEVLAILKFIENFVEYRRKVADLKRSALIVLIASARQDYDEWIVIEERPEYRNRELVQVVRRLRRYISRIHSGVGAHEWVSTDEALRILRRWFGLTDEEAQEYAIKVVGQLKPRISGLIDTERLVEELKTTSPFSPAIRWLAEKVLMPCKISDLPDAQHLRGLIKICAHMLSNAIKAGSLLASPAHIDEACIRILNEKYADVWEDHLKRCRDAIHSIERLSQEEKHLLNLVVNVVLAKSLTADADRLITAIRLWSTKSEELARRVLHLIADRSDILNALIGTLQELHKLDSALRVLDQGYVPHVIRVPAPGKIGNYGYIFILGYASPMSLYRQFIQSKIRKYLDLLAENPQLILGEIDSSLKNRIGGPAEEFEIAIVDVQGKSIESIIEEIVDKARTSRQGLRKLRVVLVNSWLLNDYQVEKLYELIYKKLSTVNPFDMLLSAIIIPRIDPERLRDFVKLYAHCRAISEFVKRYLYDPDKTAIELAKTTSEDERRLYVDLIAVFRDYITSHICDELSEVLADLTPAIWRTFFEKGYVIYVDILEDEPKIVEKSIEEYYTIELVRDKPKVKPSDLKPERIDEYIESKVNTIRGVLYSFVKDVLNYTRDIGIVHRELLNCIKEQLKLQLRRQQRPELVVVSEVPYVRRALRTDIETWCRVLERLVGYRETLNIGEEEYLLKIERSEDGIKATLQKLERTSETQTATLQPLTSPSLSHTQQPIQGPLSRIIESINTILSVPCKVEIKLRLREGLGHVTISMNVPNENARARLRVIISYLMNFIDQGSSDHELRVFK